MQFAAPSFLWALSLIAIPIIIHLFYFRRYKKVLFTNTKILEEVKDERSSRNQLKHLLTLLARIFAVVFLVLAFAQPFIPYNKNQLNTTSAISLFIDNSYSMNAEGNGQLLFDEAKMAAKEIVNAYSDNSKFQILTQDFEGKHQRFVNKNEALNMLDDVVFSPAAQNYNNIFERQRGLLKNEEGNKTSYILSDFQKNQQLFSNDTSINVNLIPVVSAQSRNVFIDSVWFEAPIQLIGESNSLVVRIRNESLEKVNGNYQLSLNGQTKNVSTYEIEANGASNDTINFKIVESGWNKGNVSLNDYPITFDDDYYFSFYVEEEIRVLTISETSSDQVFGAIFKSLENVEYSHAALGQLDYNALKENHLVILDQLKAIPTGLTSALKETVGEGKNLFVAPANTSSIPSYNQFLASLNIGTLNGVNDTKRDVTKMNSIHEALSDLFEYIPENLNLPSVNRHFLLKPSQTTTTESLFAFRNGDIFLNSFGYETGDIYVLTTPLDRAYSDFSIQPVFAPLIYKIAVLGVSSATIAYEIEANTVIRTKGKTVSGDDVLKLANETIEIIPQQSMYNGSLTLTVKGELLEAGFYSVESEKSDYYELVALNYNRKESELEAYASEEISSVYPEGNVQILEDNLAQITKSVKRQEQGKSYWKLCIALSLLFLALEILLLRFLRN